jgi:hypothetical protein
MQERWLRSRRDGGSGAAPLQGGYLRRRDAYLYSEPLCLRSESENCESVRFLPQDEMQWRRLLCLAIG